MRIRIVNLQKLLNNVGSICKCKAVVQLDKEGNVIKEYYSVGEASKKNNIPYTTLVQYIRSNRLGRGFYWKIEETSNKDLLKL